LLTAGKLSLATNARASGCTEVCSSAVAIITVFDDQLDRNACLQIATALEQTSVHPLARAFVASDNLPAVSNAVAHVAQGVSGTIAGRQWRLGKASFVCDQPASDVSPEEDKTTSVFLANDGRCVARFDIEDQLKPDAQETLQALRGLGMHLSLASGDQKHPVTQTAQSLGVTDYHYACSPNDKLALIKALQRKGERVVMVGDGINDAPVLAGADASIAPGHGALLAQTHADVILIGDSLRPLVAAVRIARRTQQIVRQNLIWAVGYNATALPLAVAGWVPPWLAAIGMSMSSLLVVLNALRLNRAG
jgi:Cu2+-exporting ATPase